MSGGFFNADYADVGGGDEDQVPRCAATCGVFFAPKKIAGQRLRDDSSGMTQATAQKSAKRGRPRKEASAVRISPRFARSTAELLEKASALRGLTVTGFVMEASRLAAERVVQEETRWQLDQRETGRLLVLLASPPKANAAARRAQALAADVEVRS